MDMVVYNEVTKTYDMASDAYTVASKIDGFLSQYLSWAGTGFPYNNINGASAPDITISSNTTWGGSKQVVAVPISISTTTAGSGNVNVVSSKISGAPYSISFAVAAGSSASTIATNVVATLNGSGAFAAYYVASVNLYNTAQVLIMAKTFASEDATLAIGVQNNTCTGITATSSVELVAGSASYTNGYVKVGKLTIAAGVTLTISRFSFYIFADEINFGSTASVIDASGMSATSSFPTSPPCQTAGGYTNNGVNYTTQGGNGGGILIICCNKITGSAGVIKANGGNGYSTGSQGYSGSAMAGSGALLGSMAFYYSNYSAMYIPFASLR